MKTAFTAYKLPDQRKPFATLRRHSSTLFLHAACGLALVLCSCSHEEPPVIQPAGPLVINFSHWANGNPLVLDSMGYTAPPANQYQVTDLQYFVSDLAFHRTGGGWVYITQDDSIHYTDLRIPETLHWNLSSGLPAGPFDTLAFTFGLNRERNRSGRFPNPPERDMFWPEPLGGGYHYLKLNLKYRNDTMPVPWPFNFHLGTGQIYSTTSKGADSITGFIDNSFRVSMPLLHKKILTGQQALELRMNIDRWFDGDSLFDIAAYPYGTMQDQQAMALGCHNGRTVFELVPTLK